MKLTLTQMRNHSASAVLALGLWLVGNALLGMQSASGQEVAKNYGACVRDAPSPYTIYSSSCSGSASSGCKGACYYYTFDTSSCDNSAGSSSNPCNNGTGAVSKNFVISNCHAPGDILTTPCTCNTDTGTIIGLGDVTTDSNYNTCEGSMA